MAADTVTVFVIPGAVTPAWQRVSATPMEWIIRAIGRGFIQF
jgi:hypothetical protein